MLENLIFTILGTLMFFIYQYTLFSYAAKILRDGSRKKVVYLFWAIVNTIIYTVCTLINFPIYLFYIVVTVALAAEFMQISKANLVQALCGASIFSLNIATVHAPVLIAVGLITDKSPLSLTMPGVYYYVITFILCFTLCFIMLPIVKKILDEKSISRITNGGKYSVLLLVTTLIAVSFQSYMMFTMITDKLYPGQLMITSVTSVFLLSMFYLVFLYSIALVNSSFYKRKSDDAMMEKANLELAKKELSDKIIKDDLTDMYSRKYTISILEKLCKGDKPGFSVVFVDINGLKYINDNYGHDAGDRLIKKISQAIFASVRDEDTVGRIGGDEFLIILAEKSKTVVELIMERIEENISLQNTSEDFDISASMGLVIVDESKANITVEEILEISDSIMRTNKRKFYEKLKEDYKA